MPSAKKGSVRKATKKITPLSVALKFANKFLPPISSRTFTGEGSRLRLARAANCIMYMHRNATIALSMKEFAAIDSLRFDPIVSEYDYLCQSLCRYCNVWIWKTAACRRCGRCKRHSLGPGNRGQCSVCRTCGSCCTCTTDSSVPGSMSHFHMDGKARMAGLEVEYNRSKSFAKIKEWARRWHASVHSDGSCGWECVTTPAGGLKLEQQINDLASSMAAAEATVDNRCGVHVHVDARDLRLAHMRNLCQLYYAVEPMLYVIGGEKRVAVDYCKPNGMRLGNAVVSNKDWHTRMFGAIYWMESGLTTRDRVRQFMNSHPAKKAGSRYVGMNLCPWVAGRAGKRTDTTVEFRLHEGTMDFVRLKMWAQICVALVDFAKSHTWEEVLAVHDLSFMPSDIVKYIQVVIDKWKGSANVDELSGSLSDLTCGAPIKRYASPYIECKDGVWRFLQCAG